MFLYEHKISFSTLRNYKTVKLSSDVFCFITHKILLTKITKHLFYRKATATEDLIIDGYPLLSIDTTELKITANQPAFLKLIMPMLGLLTYFV